MKRRQVFSVMAASAAVVAILSLVHIVTPRWSLAREEAALQKEEKTLDSELRFLRFRTKYREGGDLPKFEDAMKKYPDVADYNSRREAWEQRKKALEAKKAQ